jgi:hypothetical protein
MPNFVTRIESMHGYLNFYFNSLPSSDFNKLHVSVIDRENKLITFEMNELAKGVWVVADRIKTPHWILSMEDRLTWEIFRNSSQNIQKSKLEATIRLSNAV